MTISAWLYLIRQTLGNMLYPMTRVICFWIATKRQFCLSIYSLPISFSHTLFICLLQLTLCLVKSQSSSVARSDALQSLRWTIARKRHAVCRFAKTLAVVLTTSSDHAVNVVVRATARKCYAVLNLALNSATVSHHAVIMVLRTTAIKWLATILAVTPATTSHHALTMIISKFPARILKMTAMACHHVEERWSGVFKLSIQEIQKRLSASRFVSATLWCHALIKMSRMLAKAFSHVEARWLGAFQSSNWIQKGRAASRLMPVQSTTWCDYCVLDCDDCCP